MKRPIFIATISSINGILIGVYLNKSIPFIVAISVLIVMFSIKRKAIILYIIFLNIFSIYTYKLNNDYEIKYQQFEGKEVSVIGTIISEVEEKEYKKTYEIKVESINNNKYYTGNKILVNTKNAINSEELRYGNKINLKGTYKEPETSRNYKGFNYKFYLKTKQIYGQILNEEKDIKILKEDNLNIFNKLIYSIKEKIRKNIRKLLNEENANLELGILLGDSKNIDEDIRKAFKDSSVSHMIAISGQHMSYVIMFISFIFNKKILGNNYRKLFSILTVYFFVRLVGDTPSVLRAGITSIIYLMSRIST